MSYTVHHIIDTDVDTFWKLSFDQDLARIMLQKLGNQGDFVVLEERTEGSVTHRRIEWRANSELPEIAKKFVGDGTYTEISHFDAATKKYTADCVPNVNGDKFLTRIEMVAEPLDGGARCTRVIKTENIIKVFGLGTMLGKMAEHAQRNSHDESARFLNTWIKEQRLGGAIRVCP